MAMLPLRSPCVREFCTKIIKRLPNDFKAISREKNEFMFKVTIKIFQNMPTPRCNFVNRNVNLMRFDWWKVKKKALFGEIARIIVKKARFYCAKALKFK